MRNIILTLLLLLNGSFLYATHPIARSHYNLALNALNNHNKDQAEYFLLRAFDLDPDDDEITIQLASIHFFGREYEKAIEYFDHYLARNPHDSDFLFYMGSAHNRLGTFDIGSSYFKQAYELSHDELSRVELLKHSLRTQQWTDVKRLLNPKLWWYDENLYGKKILLEVDRSGNGIGDMIFFLRYAQAIKQTGAHVTVSVAEQLHPLCHCCPYIDEVISKKNLDEYDRVLPICIGSLMYCLRNKLYMPSRDVPYLIPAPELKTKWHEKFSSDHKFKVGLYWEGTPNQATYLGKALENPRSIAVEKLKELQKIKEISWYSLQKDVAQFPSGFAIKSLGVDFDGSHGAFMDTAAVMHELDLVISIDGSIAHLAGAVGAPVWVLLPCESDYRWFTERSDTPFYPTMRLFRQEEYGNWEQIISHISKELEQMVLLES